jgi:imidazolonepropionase-like amidohydrolase
MPVTRKKRLYSFGCLPCLLAAFLFLVAGTGPAHSQTYIENVTLVDVVKQQLLPNQTIVITGDRITEIQATRKIKPPAKADIVDGTGKFLIPGLTDAHIHFFQNGGLYTRPDVIDLRKYRSHEAELEYAHDQMQNVLQRYLKNGITQVIDVGASQRFLQQRKELAIQTDLPTIYMTGPLLTTYEPKVYANLGSDKPFNLVRSVEEGVKMVQEQLAYQPDFIKIWYIAGADGLPVAESAKKNLPIIKGIIDEAHRNKLRVAVHATERITAQLAVENGADFLVHSIDDEILNADFVGLMKKNKTILCPTLTVSPGYVQTFIQQLQFSNEELLKADPFQLGSLLDLKHLPDSTLVARYKNGSLAGMARNKTADSISRVNLKMLADAGVLIATGTDAGNIGTLHASSYLPEIKAMKESGLSNWQILIASTLNGAKILGMENEFGSVTKGKKANLVLLNANPIDTIENLGRIYRVFNQGKMLNPEEILKDSPEDLAQRQLNAYNLRNIEAFLEPYAEDVEVYMFPNSLQYKGKETMRKQYAGMFEQVTNLHCELLERIVQGNIVIDKERVQFGTQKVEAVAIYHIEGGKIKRVFFVQ